MEKKTIKQQYDELAKYGEYFEQEGYGGWSLVIDENGERALYKVCYNNTEELCARWQKIKYTCPKKEDSWPRPYITIKGVRHYLDNFMSRAQKPGPLHLPGYPQNSYIIGSLKY